MGGGGVARRFFYGCARFRQNARNKNKNGIFYQNIPLMIFLFTIPIISEFFFIMIYLEKNCII